MDTATRRAKAFEMINESNMPVSASALAKELNVSRQVIVGDVAILRAQGYEIIATARGYIVPALRDLNQHVGKIACCHNAENTINELYIIVDLGATVVNVIVEHELYGEITGPLNIKTRDDVDIFIDRVKSLEVKLLSVLTHGVHLHTIACCNKSHFEQVCHALNNAGYLVKN